MLDFSMKVFTAIAVLSLICIVVLLFIRKKWRAGQSAMVFVFCALVMGSLGDMDAHQKGFQNFSDMQAAQAAGISNPHSWRAVSEETARVAAAQQAAAEAEHQATKVREAEEREAHRASSPVAPPFNSIIATSLAPVSTGLHINSNITPVADISRECNSFRESAQNAQEQADRMRDPDLRHSWESNRDAAQSSYRAFCQ